MFGAIYGDVIGSEYENSFTKDYNFPLRPDSHFTDDSVMTAAVCNAILYNGDNICRFGIKKEVLNTQSSTSNFINVFQMQDMAICLVAGQRKSLLNEYTAMLTVVQ